MPIRVPTKEMAEQIDDALKTCINKLATQLRLAHANQHCYANGVLVCLTLWKKLNTNSTNSAL